MKIARFSQLGFILAAAGSAVGLGNIWKFPYVTGEYGGGAFVLIYLITVIAIGFSVMIAEMLIGYMGRLDSVGSFEKLAPPNKKSWKYAGFMGFTGLLILSFYSVVIGWIFHYIAVSITTLPSNVADAEQAFTNLLHSDVKTQLFITPYPLLLLLPLFLKGLRGELKRLIIF